MMNSSQPKTLEEKFMALCKEVAIPLGVEIYDLEMRVIGSREKTLRVFIIDPQTKTATIDNCVAFDSALTPHLETVEWVPENLVVEVSSPGLYRTLKSMEHFREAVGEFVMIKIKQSLDENEYPSMPKKLKGQKKFRAKLLELGDNYLNLEVNQFYFSLPFQNISKANVDPELNF